MTPSLQGYVAIFLYCVATAVSLLTVHDTAQTIPPPVITFYTFLLSTLFFSAVTARHLAKTVRTAATDKRSLLAVNLATAGTWLTGFWSAKYLSPSLFLTIFMGVAPIATFVIKTPFSRFRAELKELLAVVSVSLAVMAIVLEHVMLSSSSVPPWQGIFLGVLSGVSSSFYFVYSAKMPALAPSQILSVRFYVLIAAALALSVATSDFIEATSRISLWKIGTIALLSSIVPLYLLQIAIARIGPVRVANFIPFTCVIAYLVQQTRTPSFSATIFISVLLLCGLMSFAVKVTSRRASS